MLSFLRGQRITVGMIVGQFGGGQIMGELLEDYPFSSMRDVFEALRYAAWRAEEREVDLACSS